MMSSGVGKEFQSENEEQDTPGLEANDEIGRVRKGANIARRRNVLGRGLSALMSPSAVPVSLAIGDAPGPEREVRNPFLQSPASSHPYVDEPRTEAVEELPAAHPAPDASSPAALPPVAEAADPEGVSLLRFIPLSALTPNSAQPRQHFSEAELDALAASIRESGVLQPLVVRPLGERGRYEIVAGERRFRAASRAGLSTVPAVVRELNDRETLEIGIIENVQRADLNPIEEAYAYQRLVTEFGATQSEIAETVGKDRTSVANSLRLLKLSPEVQQLVVSGALSAGHGRALLGIDRAEDQRCLAERICRDALSVRATEDLVNEYARELAGLPDEARAVIERSGAPLETPSRPPAVAALEDRLRQAFGTKVSLNLKRSGKGEVRISFFSEAELERIIERLGI